MKAKGIWVIFSTCYKNELFGIQIYNCWLNKFASNKSLSGYKIRFTINMGREISGPDIPAFKSAVLEVAQTILKNKRLHTNV